MLTSLRYAAFAAAVMVAAPAAAQSSPVVGSWETTAKTDFGEFKATMTVAETADGYTIDIVDAPMASPGGGGPEAGPPAMESSISDVSIDGSDFSFTRSLNTPQGAMEMKYSGSVDGDTLTASVDSQFGAIPVTGTRI